LNQEEVNDLLGRWDVQEELEEGNPAVKVETRECPFRLEHLMLAGGI